MVVDDVADSRLLVKLLSSIAFVLYEAIRFIRSSETVTPEKSTLSFSEGFTK
ncbi:hypothetical protein GNE08_10855 [Trichormus variabilis ARAD]|uniref:Transposase n=1 Tax=Trichormus variabilis N2B TaxID=2681315 RepID=A0ABR6S9G9_ANAVA|nr:MULTISPECIES: hypothetical protein [Nostocaceae]MBC1214721.1 hypothetical protein [Trichormus variabilis ARAD]MBC1258459.1 hypothetical protein [Trichormus variabilis V5]MBC1269462.1 hypothetical protein [Trichormus variabilis FSR]MBC1303057.1 hypothetical protein [Trichormus variabilis N2B]MBC1312979.1 hypothetical protein [Trichormus variabilis PNB]